MQALVIGAGASFEPEIEIEVDSITFGFEDYGTIQLIKGSPEFKETNDEATRIYQDIFGTAEELLDLEHAEKIEHSNQFVETEFIGPRSVTSNTDEGKVYKTLDLNRRYLYSLENTDGLSLIKLLQQHSG